MKISQITEVIERFAPLGWQESYDNAGLIVGRPDDEVHKALLAVDVTEEVLDEAEAEGCDIVLTHHPIVFHALKRFNSADPVQRCVERAIRSRIALYACHTNLDSAPGGMSWRMAGMKTRIEHINAEIEELNTLSKQRKREVDQAKIMIGNYKEQQNNVRNNREFDAITKEIEYQELEIELAEKRLKEYAAGVKVKKAQLEEAEALSKERTADLGAKKAELEGIEAETAPLVAEYSVQADGVKEKIDERLLAAYERIRRNVRNGLAVVTVKRDACGGCFNRIPPQRQVDIRQGKKIIICEYCGRILVADPEESQE